MSTPTGAATTEGSGHTPGVSSARARRTSLAKDRLSKRVRPNRSTPEDTWSAARRPRSSRGPLTLSDLRQARLPVVPADHDEQMATAALVEPPAAQPELASLLTRIEADAPFLSLVDLTQISVLACGSFHITGLAPNQYKALKHALHQAYGETCRVTIPPSVRARRELIAHGITAGIIATGAILLVATPQPIHISLLPDGRRARLTYRSEQDAATALDGEKLRVLGSEFQLEASRIPEVAR